MFSFFLDDHHTFFFSNPQKPKWTDSRISKPNISWHLAPCVATCHLISKTQNASTHKASFLGSLVLLEDLLLLTTIIIIQQACSNGDSSHLFYLVVSHVSHSDLREGLYAAHCGAEARRRLRTPYYGPAH
jgi:hypothetical protein